MLLRCQPYHVKTGWFSHVPIFLNSSLFFLAKILTLHGLGVMRDIDHMIQCIEMEDDGNLVKKIHQVRLTTVTASHYFLE